MLQIVSTGKNIDVAIENALFELKATREDVDITILDEGGFLRKAKVSVKISDDCVSRYQKIENIISKERDELEKQDKAEKKVSANTDVKKTSEYGVSGKAFLIKLIKELGLTGEIEMSLNGADVFYDVNGENLSSMIGYRGETLYAIQFLLSVIESREDRSVGRVLLNVDHYKEQREIQLSELALKQAARAKEVGRVIKLEAMNSYERKIIHTALQDDTEVETHSEGEEPNRFLVITPKVLKN